MYVNSSLAGSCFASRLLTVHSTVPMAALATNTRKDRVTFRVYYSEISTVSSES